MSSPCPLCLRVEFATTSNKYACAVADAFPLAAGHTLIIPRRHVARLSGLQPEELTDFFALVTPVLKNLTKDLGLFDFTLGINDGREAGQTIPHVHMHVIPRRSGDVPDPRGGIRMIFCEQGRWWDQTADGDRK